MRLRSPGAQKAMGFTLLEVLVVMALLFNPKVDEKKA